MFRTEFAFLDRDEPPSVAEQATAYRAVFDAFRGREVTVRTLDIGADKPASYVQLGDQPNPALGVRGIRVARRHVELLTDQLTAIAMACRGSETPVRVMAPMVATTAEAAWFAAQCREHGIGTAGVMVEVPAAALARRRHVARRGLRVGREQRPRAVHVRDRPRRRRARRPARSVAAGLPRLRRDGAASRAPSPAGRSRCAARRRATRCWPWCS